jgi:hypothetical protein
MVYQFAFTSICFFTPNHILEFGCFVYYPQLIVNNDFFSGMIFIAFVGQSFKHNQHNIQSSGYLVTAFFVFLSIRYISHGQLLTHTPQPLHNLVSILIPIILTS